jgi:Plasmid maintenance system antidote protein
MTILPDFISPPGDTIADLIDDLGMTPAELADRMGYTLESVKLLLVGKASVTKETALKLEILGNTA